MLYMLAWKKKILKKVGKNLFLKLTKKIKKIKKLILSPSSRHLAPRPRRRARPHCAALRHTCDAAACVRARRAAPRLFRAFLLSPARRRRMQCTSIVAVIACD
jgi:hypothetical protein